MKGGAIEAGDTSKVSTPGRGVGRGIAVMDLLFRIMAGVGTMGSAIAMGTTNQTLPFVTQFIQFSAQYDDLPTLTFFVVANSIITGYFVLSLPLSIFHIIRTAAKATRVLLVIFDTVALALLTAAASAAAAIVYLAHNGNTSANWFAICNQFTDFCQQISGSLIGSFGGIVFLALLILLSAIAISRH